MNEAESRLFGEVIACPEHGGHCSLVFGADHHIPYLGWTCGGCWHTSSTADEPLMFSDHRCPRGTGFAAVMFPLLMGVVAFLVVTALVAR